MNIPVITIDGPGGSGKGTIGQLLAKSLAWHFLDSGMLYRALAYVALQQNILADDAKTLAQTAQQLEIHFQSAGNQPPRAILKGQDVSDSLRDELCGALASKIAALSRVREALVARQRQFRKAPGLVTDGRDMGSVIFPDAIAKFFLIASPKERAQRRYDQLKAAGINVSLAQLCQELIERDQRDQQRTVAPLKPASDAIVIDTTHLSINDVLREVEAKVAVVLAKGITN